MNGFFIVDKPIGMTSHDVVRHIKHTFNLKKVGHTGTLDPFASGLLIICVGKATKLSHLLSSKHKTYTGTIQLGKHYDSYDTTGKVLIEKDVLVTSSDVITAMSSFVGTYDQEPPMFSAIKIDGQKLYKLAHKGQSIERPKRRVHIAYFKLISFKDNEINFDVHVSKGTYIRSLAVDLASTLNTYGALSVLRRTSVGSYHIKDAKSLLDLKKEDLIALPDYFKHHPMITLNDYMIKLVKNGVILDERQTTMDEPFVVHNLDGQLIAYYEPIEDGRYKPVVIF